MTTADPFLPEQGASNRLPQDPDAAEHPAPGGGRDEESDLDAPASDVAADAARAAEPDPEGDGRSDEGLPPITRTPYRPPTGDSVDPADD